MSSYFKNSRFYPALTSAFGPERSAAICEDADHRLASLRTRVTDDRGCEVVRRNQQNMLPPVAAYEALTAAGLPKTEAKTFVKNLMYKQADLSTERFKKIARIPFVYPLFRRVFKSFIDKNYPPTGWDMHWHERSSRCMRFDCRRCVFVDTMAELGCPELAEVFCLKDDLIGEKLAPGIVYVRTGTLAQGHDCCDFHYYNGKTYKPQKAEVNL